MDVEVVELMSGRRLMSRVEYRITIRVLFAQDAWAAYVNQTQNTMRTLDIEKVTTTIRRASPVV